jgi:hypothetical protein
MEKKQYTLVDTDGNNVVCEQRPLTPAYKTSFYKKLIEQDEAGKAIDAEAEFARENGTLDTAKHSFRIQDFRTKCLVEQFKSVVLFPVGTEYADLPHTSEFWQQQSIPAMKEAVENFREAVSI